MTITKTYDYVVPGDDLLFQVCRIHSDSSRKTFRQRQPDGNGGWIWNLDGIDPIPYRLKDLVAADPSQPVYITEGEKAVDTLVALGMVATRNPGGAGKWQDPYSEHLHGRSVVVLPDNDAAGRRHSSQVAGVATVKGREPARPSTER